MLVSIETVVGLASIISSSTIWPVVQDWKNLFSRTHSNILTQSIYKVGFNCLFIIIIKFIFVYFVKTLITVFI